MPRFVYKAIDPSGKSISGELEASDRKRLIQQLAQQRLRPLSIQLIGEKISDDDAVTQTDFFKDTTSKPAWWRPRRSKSAIALEFLKRLLVLLSSGMPLGDAVRLLSQRLSDPQLQELCTSVWKRLSEGHTLASAMQARKQLFNASTLHLIEAGETSGNLIPVLQRIVEYLEEARDVRKNLLSSLAYPFFVLGTAFVVIIILLTFLLPRIEDMLGQLGGDLPLITQMLIGGSNFTIAYGPFILLAAIAMVVALIQWRRKESGRRTTDLWMLQLPFLGRIYLYSNIYATTNLMATLLGSGVNTTETLRLVERTIPNTILRNKFALARRQIQEGVSMAAAIQRVHYMPAMAMDILSVGENTGNIVNSLNDINRIYREELTRSLSIMTSMTVGITLAGAISLVAVIAVSVVFSVLSVGQSIQL